MKRTVELYVRWKKKLLFSEMVIPLLMIVIGVIQLWDSPYVVPYSVIVFFLLYINLNLALTHFLDLAKEGIDPERDKLFPKKWW